jgi:hypothetical protein
MGFSFNTKFFTFQRNLEAFKKVINRSEQLLSGFYIFKGFSFFSLIAEQHKLVTQPNIELSIHTIKVYIIRFYLKGIGYKFLRPKKLKNFLRIELGHSVSTYINVPIFVKLFHKRDKLIMIGFNRTQLLNFSKKIFHLRPADVYKGKGVRLSTLPYNTFKPGKQR